MIETIESWLDDKIEKDVLVTREYVDEIMREYCISLIHAINNGSEATGDIVAKESILQFLDMI